MSKLEHFVVLVGGRLVDCFRAKDLVTAFEAGVAKWAPNVSRGTNEGDSKLIEVVPLPARPVKTVITPSPKEVLEFGTNIRDTWPFAPMMLCAEL